MAQSFVRRTVNIDPDRGIFVEMLGIMEVRYTSEESDLQEVEDFLYFQERMVEIPDDFCLKNKWTTEQARFHCLVCECDMMALLPLKDHVKGKKHVRKAFMKKRQVLGIVDEPPNAPQSRKPNEERKNADVRLTLRQMLEKSGQVAIGLEYITEFNNPRNSFDYPMYTCSLEGCKAAWGTSFDIFNHCIQSKHQRNFFRKLYPEDNRISGLNKAELLAMAVHYEDEYEGIYETDSVAICVVNEYEPYVQLRSRPMYWSEKAQSVSRPLHHHSSYNRSEEMYKSRRTRSLSTASSSTGSTISSISSDSRRRMYKDVNVETIPYCSLSRASRNVNEVKEETARGIDCVKRRRESYGEKIKDND